METNSNTQIIVDNHKYVYHPFHILAALGKHHVAELNYSHTWSMHNVT
jgi:hypothetical protein